MIRLIGKYSALVILVASNACYSLRGSSGGGEVDGTARAINENDVAVLEGYSISVVARGLKFPTGVAFDERGRVHLTESGYSYGEVFSVARLVRVEADGQLTELARSDNGPWNGVAFKDGAFFVAEGGVKRGGAILRILSDGTTSTLTSGLPSLGDHHTNGPAIGPDGAIYFGQGTATNSGIVGEDNLEFGWLKRNPKVHDIPCKDVTLSGLNFESAEKKITGAFSPFGTPSAAGAVIRGAVPCSGAIMRVRDDRNASGESPVELVAWGFRNPFGLAFAPDGRLLVTDNGYDERGSRYVFGSADALWEVKEGTWYGWPDYSEGRPLADERFRSPGHEPPRQLLQSHPNPPPEPLAYFGVHSSSNGLDVSRSEAFGFAGEVFVAQFGDQAPGVGKVLHPVGFKIVRVDPKTGVISDFAVNRGPGNGPASKLERGGLERPVAVRFDPSGEALYVVDFGVLAMDGNKAKPTEGTGVLWKIQKIAGTGNNR